jgi:hypothetical protein
LGEAVDARKRYRRKYIDSITISAPICQLEKDSQRNQIRYSA